MRPSSRKGQCSLAARTTAGRSKTVTWHPGYRDTHSLARAPEQPGGGHRGLWAERTVGAPIMGHHGDSIIYVPLSPAGLPTWPHLGSHLQCGV